MENNRKLLIILGLIFASILLISNVSAYKWACLSYGDTIPHYTCHFTHCKLCLDDNNYSASFGNCYKAKNCVFGPAKNDTIPPTLTVLSPANDFVYNKSKVLFYLKTDEPSTLYYKFDTYQSRFLTIAGNRLVYNKSLGFKDGHINIIIRALDRSGNYMDIERSFYVDTKKPKVGTPKLANSYLSFNFDEINPVAITLKYGNNNTFREYNITLNNCSITDKTYKCEVLIGDAQFKSMMSKYDNSNIEYFIEVRDVANNIGKSKSVKTYIDLTSPIINNPTKMVSVSGKYAIFNISINEKNLEGAYYSDVNNPKWMKLCSSLKNGICYKKVNFPKGSYNILVKAVDISGNSDTKNAMIVIN
jgi:hypothetical protein